jgi:hypothetical protein
MNEGWSELGRKLMRLFDYLLRVLLMRRIKWSSGKFRVRSRTGVRLEVCGCGRSRVLVGDLQMIAISNQLAQLSS